MRRNGAGELELRLLGPLEAVVRGNPVPLGGAKPRAVLAVLALELGRVVSVDRLIDDLWPRDPPDTAAHAVKVYVSQLRKALAAPAIATHASGYALELAPDLVDVHSFAALAGEGRAVLSDGDPARAAELLGDALRLWRGPALADFAYEPFAQQEIARLEDLRLSALEDRIDTDLALGQHAELVGELEALVATAPFRERPRGQLMLALYRAGRQADALAAYRDARATFVDELGIEPGAELRALEAAILRQDDSLLPAAPEPSAARKTRRVATVLSADVEPAAGELDPEVEAAALERFADVFGAAVTRFGGSSTRSADGSLVALFGLPVAHEDDPIRAARAAVAGRDAVTTLNETTPLVVRIGLEAGEVLARGGDGSGRPFKAAARLRQSAAAGEIVVGEAAAPLLGHAARLELRGDGSFLLGEVAADAPAFERRLDSRLVGRRGDLAALRGALRRATEESCTRAVSVVGPAGIGKSRLAHELVARAKAVTAIAAACPPYGDGITYLPLRSLVRDATGGESHAALLAALAGELDGETVAGRLAAALGDAATPVPTGEVAWAFRRLCDALARKKPLLIVLDDVHWAAPAFLELVEHLIAHGRGPMLVVALAREDLDETSPGFLADRPNAERLDLAALRPAEAAALLEQLGGEALTPVQRERIAETAEGNPLYLEQLLALAAEGGLGADRLLPATIQALLAARLDRLGPGERSVLEAAAVVGRDFDQDALAPLLAAEAVPTVERHLRQLASRGFVRPGDRGTLRFHHGLVRETVYRSMPKAARAELHERHADTIERHGDGEAGLDELVGYHLEQAYLLRAELGPLDRHGRQLAEDAGRCLGEAGMRALKRVDYPAAVNLLGRATALLDDEDERCLELRCELGHALGRFGDDARAEAALADVALRSQDRGLRRLVLRAQIEQMWPSLLRGMIRTDDVLAVAKEAVSVLEAHGDERGLARVWSVIAAVQGPFRCQFAESDRAATKALGYVRRTGFSPEGCFAMLAAGAFAGPSNVRAAIARCEDLLANAAGSQSVPLYVLPLLGGLEAMRGRFDVAHDLLRRSAEIAAELGRTTDLAYDWSWHAARIEMLGDHPDSAEPILRAALDMHRLRGDNAWVATYAAALAHCFYAQGRFDEAHHTSGEASTVSIPDDLVAETLWRRVRGKTLVRAGQRVEGERLAREAVHLMAASDGPSLRGEALLDLAEALRLAGQDREAAAEAERGLRFFEAKESTVLAARAREILETLLAETRR